MVFKNTHRIIYASKIEEQISHCRSLQSVSKKSKYLLVNIPSRIVKNLNLSSKQKVWLRQSRDGSNKPIIIIEFGDIIEAQGQQTDCTPTTDHHENGPVSGLSEPSKQPQ
jgi:hypothetical protein